LCHSRIQQSDVFCSQNCVHHEWLLPLLRLVRSGFVDPHICKFGVELIIAGLGWISSRGRWFPWACVPACIPTLKLTFNVLMFLLQSVNIHPNPALCVFNKPSFILAGSGSRAHSCLCWDLWSHSQNCTPTKHTRVCAGDSWSPHQQRHTRDCALTVRSKHTRDCANVSIVLVSPSLKLTTLV